jgi:hypothetical protein
VSAGRPDRPPGPPGLSAGAYALLLAAFLGAALAVYRPALNGPFLSDDRHYVELNPYVHELSVENFLDILHPGGGAAVAVVNYTPVHLLLHALAWKAFGAGVQGHHLVNLVFHAIASLLLVPLFLRSGVPKGGALLAGVLFLLHPANVEAVAWISQLKTSSALVLSLVALLAFPRRPALGSALFLLALLAKPTAAFALPVAMLFEWTREGRVRWGWFALWALALAAYSFAELTVHQRSGAAEATLYERPFVLVRTVMALTVRYLVMAATSLGVSAFHEPEPIDSPLDPWWLSSLVVLSLLGWRFVTVLRQRKEELAYWVWALVSYGPVSQVFPFLYPMGDRYLYFILPGLIGATLLAGRDALGQLSRALEARAGDARRLTVRAAVAIGVAAAVLFAAHSHQRAAIWRSSAALVADSAAHYPHGVSANLLRGKRAAQLRDVDGAVAAVRAAAKRGYNRYEQLLSDRGFAPVRDHPKFRAVVREIAGSWIEQKMKSANLTQIELIGLAQARFARDERAEGAEMLRRALAVGGPLDAEVREVLAELGYPVP